MTITLEAIKSEHAKVGEMIAVFERQAATTQYAVPAVTITLAPGERYAGIVLADDGEPAHHLILLPGEAEDVNWESAVKWAQERGGSLPTRSEQSLLFANLKGQFQSSYYWSGQQHEKESGWAWCQYFHYGYQYGDVKSYKLRARAVRRLVIQ